MRLQRWFYTLPLRLRSLARRGQVESELDEELRYHLEQQIEANLALGMTADEARYAALRAMGGVEQQKERCRDMRRVSMIEDLIRDLRYGVRVLAKSPLFTAISVVTLALGIGANTAIFSVVNALLLRPLPYRDADRIVMVWEISPTGRHQNVTSRANFLRWREQTSSFENLAAFTDQRLNLTGDGEPEQVSVQLATPELFQILGVEPLLGRALAPDDARPDAPSTVVLSYGLWQRRYGGDPQAVGRTITLNGAPCLVAGVMPLGFQWQVGQNSGIGRPAEIWAVLSMPTEGPATLGRFLSVVAFLKPDVSFEQADAEMKTIAARIAQDVPQYNAGTSAEVLPLREQFVGNVRPALLMLLGAVGFVLLIACANVANLQLARAASRQKEVALRTALGAHRGRIVRQLLTESLLLSLLGSLVGLGLAWWGIKALLAISPRDLINLQAIGIDPAVLGWSLGVSLLTGLIFGLAPAFEAARVNLNDALKEGGSKGAGGQGGNRLRNMLVIAEVALALVLLVSAGLLVKSFDRLQKIDTGFDTDNVLTMVVPLSTRKYQEDRQVINFFREATGRIRSLPGVRDVGMVNYLPLYGGLGAATIFTIEGQPAPERGHEPSTTVRVADPGYFRTMGISLRRGRTFTDAETTEARHVVLISEAMARRHFPDEDPIGKRISVAFFPEPNPTEIIGVVEDVRYDSLVEEAEPTVYFAHSELTYPFMTLAVRADGDPLAVAPAVRREISALDADQPVSDVRSMAQVMAETVGRARFNTQLLALFAGLATLLAAVGIFGVMNYSVTLRTREIGIMLALGAQPGRVRLLVLRQGFLLTFIGVGIGLGGALALTRLLSGLLFGVEASDPATFAAIAVLLTLVSLFACYLPARRATKVDPLVALRYE